MCFCCVIANGFVLPNFSRKSGLDIEIVLVPTQQILSAFSVLSLYDCYWKRADVYCFGGFEDVADFVRTWNKLVFLQSPPSYALPVGLSLLSSLFVFGNLWHFPEVTDHCTYCYQLVGEKATISEAPDRLITFTSSLSSAAIRRMQNGRIVRTFSSRYKIADAFHNLKNLDIGQTAVASLYSYCIAGRNNNIFFLSKVYGFIRVF